MCPDCGQGGAQDAGVVVLLRAVEGDRGEQVDRAMAPFLMGRAHPVLTWVTGWSLYGIRRARSGGRIGGLERRAACQAWLLAGSVVAVQLASRLSACWDVEPGSALSAST